MAPATHRSESTLSEPLALIYFTPGKSSCAGRNVAAGKMEESNDRVINQLIVNNVLEEGPCQLQMGLTELKPGSVWNTMPAPPFLRTASSVR